LRNWIKHLEELKRLEAFVEDAKFRREWWQIKHDIKRDLAAYIHKQWALR